MNEEACFEDGALDATAIAVANVLSSGFPNLVRVLGYGLQVTSASGPTVGDSNVRHVRIGLRLDPRKLKRYNSKLDRC